jgi:hypothetical protein
MRLADLRGIVLTRMPEHFYRKPGAVLASSASTLTPAHAYIMGINPGGDPRRITTPIIDLLAPIDGTSAYTHDCWQPNCDDPEKCSHIGPNGAVLSDSLVKHQKNMIALAEALGATPSTILSANAIFGRSSRIGRLRDESGHSIKEWWEVCWPVHQEMLSIVRPKIIVTLGYGVASSAFGLLHAQAGRPTWRPFDDEGPRGGWIFEACLSLPAKGTLETSVIGVPHPSYHAPSPKLLKMLREIARATSAPEAS